MSAIKVSVIVSISSGPLSIPATWPENLARLLTEQTNNGAL